MLEGYTRIDLADFIGKNRSFVSSPDQDNGITVNYYLSPEMVLAAKVDFGEKTMGPPGHVHGGALAAVLDEAMGIACWFRELPVVTRSITTDFIRMVPVNSTMVLETSVEREGDGDARTIGILRSSSGGKVHVRASGSFAVLSRSALGNLGIENVRTEIN